ncbi:AAA domain-containing protein [Runella sp.]|uniref:AAA domain-containing protein n=1 Tax=Runella sp. TaxID=1960881 RepID=UPI003016508F
MTSEEIKQLSINGSERYLSYLKTAPSERNAGESIIKISSIQEMPKWSYSLELSGKIFDLDRLKFRIMTPEQTNYDNISVVEYDYDKNTIEIKPPESIRHYFTEKNKHNILIVSDLKFLVERVRDWYSTNGEFICLPSNCSSVVINNNYSPNTTEQQKIAINTIFDTPFSYIWGAPGTGKTQFVLSDAVLRYIREGKRVGIFAPTNNAIEQVLRGVLKQTKEAGIDDEKIIRLGNPSRKFAEQFPKVCEVKGLEKNIEEFENQINIYKKVKRNREIAFNWNQVDNCFELFTQLRTDAQKRHILYRELNEVKDRVEETKLQYNRKTKQANDINDNIVVLQKKTSAFVHSIKKLFNSNLTKEEILLKNEKRKFDDICREVDAIGVKIVPLQRQLSDLQDEYQDKSKINQLLSKIKRICSIIDVVSAVVQQLNEINYDIVEEELKITIKNGKESLPLDQYRTLSVHEIDRKIETYIAEIDFLKNQTVANRIEKCNVVAATLDCYIGRFKDEDLPIEHVFLDEAGYANIVKAMTLFRYGNRPITFLGDHKQLPPVCEMNEQEIKTGAINKNVFVWSQSAIYIDNIFEKNDEQCYGAFINDSLPLFNNIVKKNLTKSHRFGMNLANILGKHVYNDDDDIKFTGNDQKGETEIFYISVITHPIQTDEKDKKRVHPAESEEICKIIPFLKKEFILRKELNEYDSASNYVILSPYTNQIRYIGTNLPIERRELKILTVHGSQGREWHTVILSVSDTNNMFFTDSRKNIGQYLINTAVSRAKKRLIIVCNYNFWITQPNQLISDLLKVAKPLNI